MILFGCSNGDLYIRSWIVKVCETEQIKGYMIMFISPLK